MAWTAKEAPMAFKLAATGQAWGAEQTIGAGSGIKQGKIDFPLGLPEIKAEETTDAAWATVLDMGDVKPIDFSLEYPLRYNPSTSIDPYSQILMAVLYDGTSVATPGGGTNSRLHTGTIASNHALSNSVSRFGTLAWRDKLVAAGYGYTALQSWQPDGFELTSASGGTEPVKVKISGKGDRVLTDQTTPATANTATPWGNVTYVTDTNLAHHRHIGATGCWFAKSAAVGGSTVTFGTSQAVKPQELSIKFSRKYEGFHTTTMYADQPIDNGFAECEVTMKFPHMLDAYWTGLIKDAKDYEAAGVESAYHLKWRYTFPTVIEGSLYPYFEIGIPRMILKSVKMSKDAGKVIPLEATFTALQPTAYAHLPTCFQYVGGTSGAAMDCLYVAVQNTCTTAYIA